MAAETRLADEWAGSMAQTWFLDASGQDRLIIDGLSAGWASQIEVYQALRQLAASRLGADAPQRDTSLLATLKEWGADRLLRWLGLRFSGTSPAQSALPARVLLLSEIPTPSMLDPLVAVGRALGLAAAPVVADPRAVSVWARTGVHPIGAWVDARTVVRMVRKGAREFDARWAAIERDPPEMKLGDQDLVGEALPLLQRLLRQRMAWLPAEAAAIDRLLRRVQPASLILGSDQHRLGRVSTELARRSGVKTLVIQHGLPQDRLGYVPVVADAVACWSAHSRDWFVAQGTDAERLVVTGSPALEADTSPQPIPRIPRILCLLSPTVSGLNERLTRTLLCAAEQLQWPVTLKLHPGHRSWAGVLSVVAQFRNTVDVRVRHREPLVPLIDEATLVVIHRSTTALQALARRRPVIVVLDPAAGSFSELDAPALQLPTASTPSELVAILADLGRPERAEEYFRLRGPVLEYALGPCDGRSAMRIAQLALAT